MLHCISVSGIDNSALGGIIHKKPDKEGKKIYIHIYRNAFINEFGADSWDAFFQSIIHVCGTPLLLEIGTLPVIVEGTLLKNRPIWNGTLGLPQYFARIKKHRIAGMHYWTQYHRYTSHVQVFALVLIQCTVCRGPGKKRCGRCRKVHYCSRDHHKSHWMEHKRFCRTLAAMSMQPPQYPETQAERLCRSSSTDAPSFNPGRQCSAYVVESSDKDQDQDHVESSHRVIDPAHGHQCQRKVQSVSHPLIRSSAYLLIC